MKGACENLKGRNNKAEFRQRALHGAQALSWHSCPWAGAPVHVTVLSNGFLGCHSVEPDSIGQDSESWLQGFIATLGKKDFLLGFLDLPACY